MFNLTTSIKHSIGNTNNQTRKRNRRHPQWKRSKVIFFFFCRWHDSICINPKEQPHTYTHTNRIKKQNSEKFRISSASQSCLTLCNPMD